MEVIEVEKKLVELKVSLEVVTMVLHLISSKECWDKWPSHRYIGGGLSYIKTYADHYLSDAPFMCCSQTTASHKMSAKLSRDACYIKLVKELNCIYYIGESSLDNMIALAVIGMIGKNCTIVHNCDDYDGYRVHLQYLESKGIKVERTTEDKMKSMWKYIDVNSIRSSIVLGKFNNNILEHLVEDITVALDINAYKANSIIVSSMETRGLTLSVPMYTEDSEGNEKNSYYHVVKRRHGMKRFEYNEIQGFQQANFVRHKIHDAVMIGMRCYCCVHTRRCLGLEDDYVMDNNIRLLSVLEDGKFSQIGQRRDD